MSTATATADARRPSRIDALLAEVRRNGWLVGLVGLLVLFLAITKLIQPNYAAPGIQGLAISVLPIAFAAIAQAIVVISGGVDLSVGPIMALTSVSAAVLMDGQSDLFAVGVVVAILLMGIALGTINGTVIVWTRVPDIVVTLAMAFVWAGCALLVLDTPGGGAAPWLMTAIQGPFFDIAYLPKAFVVLAVIVALVWIPLRRSRLGLSLYAVGSDRLAAFRSGVAVGRTKIVSYALMGLFAALGGLTLTASTGIGNPVPGSYTLDSVAAAVLGGVSLAGGRGGVVGPILAVVVLYLIRTDLTFLGINPNLSTVIQGAITIGVVVFGSFVALRRARA
jgi:ribose transport system permease protein